MIAVYLDSKKELLSLRIFNIEIKPLKYFAFFLIKIEINNGFYSIAKWQKSLTNRCFFFLEINRVPDIFKFNYKVNI